MLTTVVIAITVHGPANQTFHPSAVSSFLRTWEDTPGLPPKLAQDIRWYTAGDSELADMANKKALGEVCEGHESD